MYRIKDPKVSLPFYTGVLGMQLLQKMDFPDMKFSLYFMGYEAPSDIPGELGSKGRTEWCMSRKATLELTQYVSHLSFMYTYIAIYYWRSYLSY